LAELTGPGGRVEVEQAIREDRRRVKAIHAYYGCLVTDWFHKP
jgi:hypothetical protein